MKKQTRLWYIASIMFIQNMCGWYSCSTKKKKRKSEMLFSGLSIFEWLLPLSPTLWWSPLGMNYEVYLQVIPFWEENLLHFCLLPESVIWIWHFQYTDQQTFMKVPKFRHNSYTSDFRCSLRWRHVSKWVLNHVQHVHPNTECIFAREKKERMHRCLERKIHNNEL